MSLSRRTLLAGAGTLLAGASAQDHAFAKAFGAANAKIFADTRSFGGLRPSGQAAFGAHPVGPRSLWLQRTDGQEIMVRFRDETSYDRAAIMQLSWFMRDLADHGHAVWMEPRLFDLLAGVQHGMSTVAGAPVPLVVTSGYRTPAHNARIETAARNSMHLYGYAADLYAPGYSPRALALAASFFAGGGIGLYDNFTHLDVWKVRAWLGAPAHRPVAQGEKAGTVMKPPA
ncbi:MAG: YcbK family protein [Caulobacteraceae bacterium]|nr:YcbK family protein [Caulobacter sp.]